MNDFLKTSSNSLNEFVQLFTAEWSMRMAIIHNYCLFIILSVECSLAERGCPFFSSSANRHAIYYGISNLQVVRQVAVVRPRWVRCSYLKWSSRQVASLLCWHLHWIMPFLLTPGDCESFRNIWQIFGRWFFLTSRVYSLKVIKYTMPDRK